MSNNDLIQQIVGGIAFGGAIGMVANILYNKYLSNKSDKRISRMVEARWRPVFRDRETGEITWRYAVGYTYEERAWDVARSVEIMCKPNEMPGVEEIPLETLLQEFRDRHANLVKEFREERGEELK